MFILFFAILNSGKKKNLPIKSGIGGGLGSVRSCSQKTLAQGTLVARDVTVAAAAAFCYFSLTHLLSNTPSGYFKSWKFIKSI